MILDSLLTEDEFGSVVSNPSVVLATLLAINLFNNAQSSLFGCDRPGAVKKEVEYFSTKNPTSF